MHDRLLSSKFNSSELYSSEYNSSEYNYSEGSGSEGSEPDLDFGLCLFNLIVFVCFWILASFLGMEIIYIIYFYLTLDDIISNLCDI